MTSQRQVVDPWSEKPARVGDSWSLEGDPDSRVLVVYDGGPSIWLSEEAPIHLAAVVRAAFRGGCYWAVNSIRFRDPEGRERVLVRRPLVPDPAAWAFLAATVRP